MNARWTSTLAVTGGLAIAGPQADLGFDPNQMFFRYIAPSTGTVDFQMLPDNRYNPIVVPCDLEMFGGQVNFNYLGTGPTVFPKITETFFNYLNNRQIISGGCTGLQVLSNVSGGFYAITAGTVETVGYYTISSGYGCPFLFQPSDLPPDTVVRIHWALTAYPDDTFQGNVVTDPNPSNNEHDIYVRRSCSCQ